MKTTQNKKSPVFFLAITALLTALVYVFTAFVNIRLPITANGGLIHLGNVPLFIGAILFGKRVGAIAGGVGMALFDLLSGWTIWAPFTLVIVGLMGFVVGLICERRNKFGRYIAAIAAAPTSTPSFAARWLFGASSAYTISWAGGSSAFGAVSAAAIAAACAIKVAGYYIAEAVIYQNWIAPAASIPGNLVQIGCAAVVVLAVIVPLKKAAGKVLPAYALS